MQAGNAWKPAEGTLGALVHAARDRVDLLAGRRPELTSLARSVEPPPSLEAALLGAMNCGHLGLIAEIKRASPSQGAINAEIDAAEQARAFARGGATAISVLTEPGSFGGSPDDLIRARGAVSIPLLKKDFHVHPVQALEARAIGASALLLIARALGPNGLRTMADAARDQGVEVVVEVRDEAELEWALSTGSRIIGVNNRDLETLEIDPRAGDRIIPLIPPDRIAIAESGISHAADARLASRAGADAILVGSSLSAAADPAAAARALSAIDRVGRGS